MPIWLMELRMLPYGHDRSRAQQGTGESAMTETLPVQHLLNVVYELCAHDHREETAFVFLKPIHLKR